jgi:hypothetical protein
VAWYAGILNAGPRTFFGEYVTVADATGLYFDADLLAPGSGMSRSLRAVKSASSRRNLRHLHGSGCDF